MSNVNNDLKNLVELKSYCLEYFHVLCSTHFCVELQIQLFTYLQNNNNNNNININKNIAFRNDSANYQGPKIPHTNSSHVPPPPPPQSDNFFWMTPYSPTPPPRQKKLTLSRDFTFVNIIYYSPTSQYLQRAVY